MVSGTQGAALYCIWACAWVKRQPHDSFWMTVCYNEASGMWGSRRWTPLKGILFSRISVYERVRISCCSECVLHPYMSKSPCRCPAWQYTMKGCGTSFMKENCLSFSIRKEFLPFLFPIGVSYLAKCFASSLQVAATPLPYPCKL